MTLKELLRSDFANYVRPHFEKSECECCGSDTERLHVHHVKYFQDLLDETLKILQLEYHDDTDMYSVNELQLIREVMLGKQMTIQYVTCCEPCHLELHDGSYRPTTKTKEELDREREEKEERRKKREQLRLEQELKEQQKIQEIKEIQTKIKELFEVGQQYKYKTLCEPFGLQPTGGDSKKRQFKIFEQYMRLEKNGTWYTVVEIYEEIREKKDGRKNNGKNEASLKALEQYRYKQPTKY